MAAAIAGATSKARSLNSYSGSERASSCGQVVVGRDQYGPIMGPDPYC